MRVAEITRHDVEVECHASGARFLVGMDEVGRGALAGPVGVGAVRVDAQALADGSDRDVSRVPDGLRDSKQVPVSLRGTLARTVAAWRPEHAVAYASAQEIDAVGISLALCLAGRRALAALAAHGDIDLVLLDGSHDWLSAPLTLDAGLVFGDAADVEVPRVRTIVKGDGSVATIAAASVLAKVDRDARMQALDAELPGYGWCSNVGYGSAAHREAIASLGVTEHHRRSWAL
ncbi:ribonuclease HII [Brevibacterium yomogidense]|uniref:ribonuclease HII n=1 Tax=Brevibacterium yomogidense TaxID=946573 RepID=UPI0018DF9BC1|nr:ribonuclease HII [Brevibacterium yomogidense]